MLLEVARVRGGRGGRRGRGWRRRCRGASSSKRAIFADDSAPARGRRVLRLHLPRGAGRGAQPQDLEAAYAWKKRRTE